MSVRREMAIPSKGDPAFPGEGESGVRAPLAEATCAGAPWPRERTRPAWRAPPPRPATLPMEPPFTREDADDLRFRLMLLRVEGDVPRARLPVVDLRVAMVLIVSFHLRGKARSGAIATINPNTVFGPQGAACAGFRLEGKPRHSMAAAPRRERRAAADIEVRS